MKKPVLVRQGDVLVVEAKRQEGLRPLPREGGRVVLAHGEVTGHSHAIASKAAVFAINEQTQRRFLEVTRPVTLSHEEHSPIQLKAGSYEVVIQREYSPSEMSRSVVD